MQPQLPYPRATRSHSLLMFLFIFFYTRDLYQRGAYLYTLHSIFLIQALLSVLSIVRNGSLVALCCSYSLHFSVTLETLVEEIIIPLIMTLGRIELDLGFYFFFLG